MNVLIGAGGKRMLPDKEIIQKFHQQISYASECKIQELGGFIMTSTQYVLYMPCN